MSLERDPSTGPTLGLDFPKGRVFADEIYKASGLTVHPMENLGSFTLAVSFNRHDFAPRGIQWPQLLNLHWVALP